MLEIIKRETIRLYPNKTMQEQFDKFCSVRNYYWNKGLETWNAQYQNYLKSGNKADKPSEYKVRNALVAQKQDWERLITSHVLKYAIADLNQTWQMFLKHEDKRFGKPHFKSQRRATRLGFKLEYIKKFDSKFIELVKPRAYKGDWFPIKYKGGKHLSPENICSGISFYKENGKYYASFSYRKQMTVKLPKTKEVNGIDLNVHRFTDNTGDFNILPDKLLKYYQKIKYYQRSLAKKRVKNSNWKQSKNYAKTRTKLNALYTKTTNYQHELVKQYANRQLKQYQTIVIEDLNVQAMKMGIASKGLHRSLFGYFKSWMQGKVDEFDSKLILADRFYPSTQRCSACGHIKTADERITLSGNAKHHTKHNEYICYECGFECDRDKNAVLNLIAYKDLNWSRVATQN